MTGARSGAALAPLLFEDDFNRGIPGWTAVQPTPATYLDGPMRWQYDIVTGSFIEQSNIYTDAAAASPSATAVMLINSAAAPTNFTYKARLIAGDDDAFGLIFGYQNANNFYRVTFTRQVRTVAGYPWNGWNVDQRISGVSTNLFGHGTPNHVDSFFNASGRPFDVTILVTNANRLTLTVTDDPDNAPVEFRLVQNEPLPRSAAGQVGLVTWGQSGSVPRGFQILNPTLQPVALAGNPNALTNWTPVIPPRQSGEAMNAGSGNGGRPIWSLALGPNGAYGTLHENSDAFGGNDASGQVDFVAPAVVAGNMAWTNYIMTARILPTDDDGHGVLIRYKDEQNFYRVALRNQNSTTGPRKGLSIQKVVNGVYEEVYRDNPVKYDPVANIPYDISVAVVGNQLQALVVGNPAGNAQTFIYGPFDITGGTVDNGKIGLFSWGMSRTEFDFVRVFGIDGTPLQVSSAFGTPEPPVGVNSYPFGSSITASVPGLIVEQPGLRRASLGWTGLGSVPASGTNSTVTFTLNSISVLNWIWRTEVQLTATAEPGGTISGPSGQWLAEGTEVIVTAAANPDSIFVGWAGDLASNDPVLKFKMNRPYNLRARFEADSDNDGLADRWEQTYFGNLSAQPNDDPDNDGASNLLEYQKGTNPASVEKVLVSDGLVSRWENMQRDPALPGMLQVRDFGGGFRGAWENSNDFRNGDDTNFLGAAAFVANASFEGPRIVIRTNVWKAAWNNFTAETIITAADNDGNCVYFRYADELNWYRVTILGELNNDVPARPVFGVSIQKRVNGVFSEVLRDASIATDPSDVSFYKRVRITVKADGPNFEVRVIGWNVNSTPADWLASSETVYNFSDGDIPAGRFGVGTWGQSGGGPATTGNPVNAGVLIEDVVISAGGVEVFREDWEQIPLFNQLPAGWSNPLTGTAAGDWRVSAHQTIMQQSNFAPGSSGTLLAPKADADGTILLAPPAGDANYFLEIGFHPFDDDGIGFIYDFVDTNNYSRAIFVSEASNNGRIPQGLSVSRKAGGVWSDIFAGDNTFIYRNGRPFSIEFSNNNGQYQMRARDLDDPSRGGTWRWVAPAAAATNRFGLTCWGETDAHFLYARAYGLGAAVAGELRISKATLAGGNLTLDVSNPGGASYSVESADTLEPGSWRVVAQNQSAAKWTIPLRPGAASVFYRLSRAP